VSEQAETCFGYSRDELQGQLIDILVPHHLWDVHAAHRTAYGTAPRVRYMDTGAEFRGRRKDGSEFPV
jgi:PAS domain S-box-containing protein